MSTSTSRSVDYGGTRSDLHTFIRSIRAGLSAFSAAYDREHALSRAEIITNLTALRDTSGADYLLAEQWQDRKGKRYASGSRSWADRRLRREWARLEREISDCEERGWSVEDREALKSAWSARPKSLIELAQGMTTAVQSQATFVSALPVTTTTTTTPDTTKSTAASVTTSPAGTTTTREVTTETKASDKEGAPCCPASTG